MADDIVTRLRQNLFYIQEGCGEFACEYLDTDLTDKDLLEAADEIERLRAEVKHWKTEALLNASYPKNPLYTSFIHPEGTRHE